VAPSLAKTETSGPGKAAARLAGLVSLDLPGTRMLSGDEARAASEDLDDSGWQIIYPGEPWTADAAWLPLHITAPERDSWLRDTWRSSYLVSCGAGNNLNPRPF